VYGDSVTYLTLVRLCKQCGHFSKPLVTVMTERICIWKVPASKLSRESNYPEWFSVSLLADGTAVAQSVTRLGSGLDDRGVISGKVSDGIFSLATASRPALRPTQPPIQWVSRTLTPGVKRPEHEVDHWSPSSAKGKNDWSYTSALPISSHGVILS
jgi:hypothetical protein